MALPPVSQNTLTRIATLLASNLPANKVSAIVGLSPARISQIQTTEEYQNIFTEISAAAAEKNVEEEVISAKYLSAEHVLIDQVMQMAPSAELKDVTQALRVVAERQEKAATRKNPVHAGVVVHQNIVQLNLPTHALPEVVISNENEVIDVNGKNMAPLTAQGVESLFAMMKEKKHDQGRILEGSSCHVTEAVKETGYAASQLSFAF
jgi:hypothetical protein